MVCILSGLKFLSLFCYLQYMSDNLPTCLLQYTFGKCMAKAHNTIKPKEQKKKVKTFKKKKSRGI